MNQEIRPGDAVVVDVRGGTYSANNLNGRVVAVSDSNVKVEVETARIGEMRVMDFSPNDVRRA